MLKNKIILSSLFLVTAVSCSNIKPIVLTNGYLNPTTTTNVTYENLNFSTALFNQYASGLSYKFRMNYSTQQNFNLFFGILYNSISGSEYFSSWDTITSTYAEAELNSTWRTRLNTIFFDRQFDRSTKKALTNPDLWLFKQPASTLNYEIIITSLISYSVNIGSIYLAFLNQYAVNLDNFYIYIDFYDSNELLLQTILLENLNTTTTALDRLYAISDIITNVKSFRLKFQWVDIPPEITSAAYIRLREFNLFTQGAEISIPDEADGDLFGFEFVAVEWWNILGHLQNFMWWIVNKSPIRFIFEFIDTYIISFIEGFIDIITGVFNL